MGECLRQVDGCPVKANKRRSVGHHKKYFASLYKTPLEIAYRNDPSNIEQRCECIERADPHRNPTPPPSVGEMILKLTIPFEDGTQS